MLLVVHMLLGYRELRHIKFYENDPMVKRILGLTRLPDVSTVSRCLSSMDAKSVYKLQQMIGGGVLDRLVSLSASRITPDFDGSVIGTGRFAEGTAVGFDKKKKVNAATIPFSVRLPRLVKCSISYIGQVRSMTQTVLRIS